MIVASRGRKGGQLLRYSSPDMLHWRYDGVFLENLGDMAECPRRVCPAGQTVVVTCLMHADARRYGCGQPVVYAAGKTEGAAFRAGYPFRTVDQGMDFYAPQSLSLRDGRQVMNGWAFTWEHRWPVQARQWAGMMTLPRVCCNGKRQAHAKAPGGTGQPAKGGREMGPSLRAGAGGPAAARLCRPA